MDITSYLLGKKASGGGGADLSDYFETTITVGTNTVSGFANMIKTIPENTTVVGNSMQYAFSDYKGITIPLIDTSNVKYFTNMFLNAINLKTIPLIDTSNGINFSGMFQGCSNLISVPLLDTSNCTNIINMFSSCINLETVPILNISKLSRLSNMFTNCHSLNDTSLDNILQMCISGGSISSSRKTLSDLGLTATDYPASRIEALPHYQDFINAGWTIGY